MRHNNNGGLGKTIVGLGAAAALVGTYLLYGSKKGAARREKVKGWMLKMRGEVLEEVENLKEMSQDAYYKIVDEVKSRYRNKANVEDEELDEVADELKEGWSDIVGEVEETKEEVKDTIEKPRRRKKI
jgi:hypothetical protein